ncbi:MAG: hypothetical protein COB51_08040 [Moraxellaceae bacterium]|nr:MAG: hypothetical protein COB51_08040 [Moraxellaceae bacterium]
MKRVVIADDSVSARLLLKQMILECLPDIPILEFKSGEAVTKNLAEIKDCWFLLDMNMAPLNGLDTIKLLLDEDIPPHHIAMVTANKSKELKNKLKTLDILCINKAIEPHESEQCVAKLDDFFKLSK